MQLGRGEGDLWLYSPGVWINFKYQSNRSWLACVWHLKSRIVNLLQCKRRSMFNEMNLREDSCKICSQITSVLISCVALL